MISFTEIKADKLQLTAGVRILKASDYNAYLGSKDLVDAAQKKAQDIETQAQLAYDKQKKRGYQAGLQQAQAEQTQLMLETLKQCDTYVQNQLPHLGEILQLAMQQLIADFDKEQLCLKMAQQAIESIAQQRQGVLRVNSKQLNFVKANLATLLKDHPEIVQLDVQADDRLSEGGCFLETPIGIIDASLDNQLANIRATFEQLQT